MIKCQLIVCFETHNYHLFKWNVIYIVWWKVIFTVILIDNYSYYRKLQAYQANSTLRKLMYYLCLLNNQQQTYLWFSIQTLMFEYTDKIYYNFSKTDFKSAKNSFYFKSPVSQVKPVGYIYFLYNALRNICLFF